MILLPLLAITALVLKVQYISALQDICSCQFEPQELQPGDTIQIKSPNFPENYPDNMNCKWNLQFIGVKDVRISCNDFDVEEPNNDGTCEDFLEIGNNRYCGKIAIDDVTVSVKESETLTFFSNNEKSERGFNCIITAPMHYGKKVSGSFQLNNREYNDKLGDPKSEEFALMAKEVYDSIGVGLEKELGTKLTKFEITGFKESLHSTFSFKNKKRPLQVDNDMTTNIDNSDLALTSSKHALQKQKLEGDQLKNIKAKVVMECILNWDTDFPKTREAWFRPLILYNNLIVHPEVDRPIPKKGIFRYVRVDVHNKLILACPGTEFIDEGTNIKKIEAKCIDTGEFTIEGKRASYKTLNSFRCKKRVKSVLNHSDKKCGPNNAKLLEIGWFAISDTHFHPLITACYSEKEEQTLWTKHKLYGSSYEAKDVGIPRPDWTEPTNIDTAYKIRSQREYFFEKKVDLQKLKLGICQDMGNYFAHGHMSPDADFITAIEQNATYNYPNAVPQWQIFNNGHWRFIEDKIQQMAKERLTDLDIITGAYGTLRMEAIKPNKKQKIILGEEILPVPGFVWKVVVEKSRIQNVKDKAVAFVVTNNPNILDDGTVKHFRNIQNNGICGVLNWLSTNFDAGNKENGYAYCLTVKELKKVVSYVPVNKHLTDLIL